MSQVTPKLRTYLDLLCNFSTVYAISVNRLILRQRKVAFVLVQSCFLETESANSH